MWIESHQELGRHPKTKRLARLLKLPLAHVVGQLHFLWWWALDYADNGDLGRYTTDDIAEAMLYEGDSQTLIDALLGAGADGEPGFLERDEQGHLRIHDWHDYAGRLLEQRERARQRTAEWRVAHRTHTVRIRDEHATDSETVPYVATGPNLTVPNQTKPDHVPGADAPAPAAPKARKAPKAPSERKPPANAEQFSALAAIEGFDPCGPIPDSKRGQLNGYAADCAAQKWTAKAIEKIAELWGVAHPDGPPVTAHVVVMNGARLLRNPPRGPAINRNGKANGYIRPLELANLRPNVMKADGTIYDADGNYLGREGDAVN